MSNFLDAGFGTLDQLKARVLPKIMVESYDTTGEWDAELRTIGKTAAGMINRYCRRDFERHDEAVFTAAGGMKTLSVPCYPINVIAAIELDASGVPCDVMDNLDLVRHASGLVQLHGYLGNYSDQVKVTYSGGYQLGETEGKVLTHSEPIPPGSSIMEMPLPAGFSAPDVAQVSVRRVRGAAQLELIDWAVQGSTLTARFSGVASEGNFHLAVLLLSPPDSGADISSLGFTGGVMSLPVPAGVSSLTSPLPVEFDENDVAAVNVRRIAGEGYLTVVDWAAEAGVVTADLSSAPVVDDTHEVVVSLMSAPSTAPIIPLANDGRAMNTLTHVAQGLVDVTAPVPEGFADGEITQVSLKRAAGDEQVEITSWAVVEGVIYVSLSAPVQAAQSVALSVLAISATGGEALERPFPPLPDEIFGAWIMQCQAAIEQSNTLWGGAVQRSEERTGSLGQLTLLPAVERILTSHRRFR